MGAHSHLGGALSQPCGYFFQTAFGGSFLNHQWLIAAATPTFPNPPASQRSIIDSNGMVTNYPLYTATGTVLDTTSILATIEHRFGLDPLGSRDAAVADLSSVFSALP